MLKKETIRWMMILVWFVLGAMLSIGFTTIADSNYLWVNLFFNVIFKISIFPYVSALLLLWGRFSSSGGKYNLLFAVIFAVGSCFYVILICLSSVMSPLSFRQIEDLMILSPSCAVFSAYFTAKIK